MKRAANVARKTRIFVVDDHPVVRRGLQFMLGVEPNLTVCGEAENGPEALEKIMALEPDAVVVDLALKGSSGLDLIRNLRSQCPKVKLLVFSMHDELFYAERVLRMGAHGYVTKEEGAEKAVEALRTILQGKKYFSQAVANRILDTVGGSSAEAKAPSIERLSDRELEVLQLIGSGVGTRAIAERLRLSVKTIESYRENIKSKLGLGGATELTSYAYEWVHRDKPV
jgi:DNA-binding NarL/FixJ family response regulator